MLTLAYLFAGGSPSSSKVDVLFAVFTAVVVTVDLSFGGGLIFELVSGFKCGYPFIYRVAFQQESRLYPTAKWFEHTFVLKLTLKLLLLRHFSQAATSFLLQGE